MRSSSAPRRSAVLVDPHPLWLEQLDQVLTRVDVDVVVKTTSPTEALDAIEEHHPDLLLLELDDPELIPRARAALPELKVIVVSMYDAPEGIDAALRAGACAYVLKTAHPGDITSAIRQAFGPSVFFNGMATGAGLPSAEGTGALVVTPMTITPAPEEAACLTRRELEILQLVAEGHSNAALSRMLWVTEQTVKFHLSNIYRKLDVSNRTEASRWAQLRGLLPDSSQQRMQQTAG
jgi:DNA-binding NarL/FixJ family response regulator